MSSMVQTRVPFRSRKRRAMGEAVPVVESKTDVVARRGVARLSRLVSTLKPELKTLFTEVSVNISSGAGQDVDLNAIAEGSGDNERVGRMVKSKWLEIQGCIGSTASATVPACVRIVVYVPYTATNALGAAFAPNDPISFDQFKVLFDRPGSIDVHGSGNAKMPFRIRLNLRNMPVRWLSGTAADFTQNRLRLGVFVDAGAAATTTLQYYTRYFYTDA